MFDTGKKQYCAICAAPCLSPEPSDAPNIPQASQPPVLGRESDWLATHALLGYPSINLPSPATITPGPEYSPSGRHNRQIPIHKHCLSSVLRLEGSAHGRRMVQVWSLPKWTGWIDWDGPAPNRKNAGWGGMGGGRSIGVDSRGWMGLGAQRLRWTEGKRHYLEADLVNPVDIPKPQPGPSAFDLSVRPRQLHSLATLPPHILLQIATYLLDPYEDPSYAIPRRRLAHPPAPRPHQVAAPHPDLRALLNTSSSLRYFPFPSYFWKELVRDQVDQYKYQLLYRWDASPGRAAVSLDRLEGALEEEFSGPVEAALDAEPRSTDNDEAGPGMDVDKGQHSECAAREVFYWWTFSPAWRSRRRVWRCVVFGAAQARDADWL